MHLDLDIDIIVFQAAVLKVIDYLLPLRDDNVKAFIMMSSKRNILLAFCAGNSLVTGEFPSQRLVTRGFDVFFDLRLNTWLSKQSRPRWFETQSRSLWRRCNVTN